MAPLQGLLFQMLCPLIAISSNVDPKLTLVSVHNNVDDTFVDHSCSGSCDLTDRRLQCIDCIPMNATSTVSEIVLSGFNESNIVPHMFCGVSWPSVVNLTILNSDPASRLFNITDFTFDCLLKIQTLKLKMAALQTFSHNALYGLDNVTTLDLSDCIRLTILGLAPALSLEANVPMIHTLVLSNVGSAFGGVKLSQNFVDTLAQRRIRYLDLSFCTVGVVNKLNNGLCKYVEKINLAKSRVIYSKDFLPSTCDSLRVIDFSGTVFTGATSLIGNVTMPPAIFTFNKDWFLALSTVSVLYLNNMISTEHFLFLNNVTFIVQEKNSLTEIHATGYSLPVCELKFKIDPNHLEYFDLSNNKIERLSPDFLAYLEHLKRIDLSHNRLATSNQLENTFSNIFRNNAKLEVAELAHNGFTKLPSNMFEFNTELKRIDMSKNKATQIPFEIAHLYNLELFDLRGNAIEYLNGWSRHQIDTLYKNKEYKRNTAEKKSLTLDLRDNAFSCKCHSLDFIKWFIYSPVFEDSRDLYYCEVDGKRLSMNTDAIETVLYDCDKPNRQVRKLLFIVVLPCVSTGLLVVMAIVLFKRYKRQKLLRRVRKHIYLIHEDQSEYRFPVFLSYASEDSEFVEPNILQPLTVSIGVTLSAIFFSISFKEATYLILNIILKKLTQSKKIMNNNLILW